MEVLRSPVEATWQSELEYLVLHDRWEKPPQWRLSPRSVVEFVLGSEGDGEIPVSPKFLGERRLVEIAVAALTTDAALLLLGPPGCGKSWLSELLAAAISGDSSLLIQGTAGMSEEVLRYGWNYAQLLNEGPTEKALLPSPILQAMRQGKLVRLEEMSRIPTEVQDGLLSILSEKVLAISEMRKLERAKPGFNIIATSNQWDRGTFEPSAAMLRRFCVVQLTQPTTVEEETRIVLMRLGKTIPPTSEAIETQVRWIVQMLRELRTGITSDGKHGFRPLQMPTSVADSLAITQQGLAMMRHFGDGNSDLAWGFAAGMQTTMRRGSAGDRQLWAEYLEYQSHSGTELEELAVACLKQQHGF